MNSVEVVWTCCCLTMLSVVPVNGACVMVSPNITVKPTPEPLLDPGQRVDISLKCVGSEKYLSYYIRNNVIWDFKDNNGTFHPITYSFYEAQGNNTQYADLNFKSGRFEFKHDATKDDNYQFILSIHGVKYSDDGEYTCTLMKGSTKTVADMKTVKVTVVHPVDSVILSLYDSRGAKVEVSNASVVAREIKPGKYTAQCQATGSNPAPKIEIKIDGNSIVASDTGYKAIVSGRPSYSGTVRQNITIAALDIDQFFTCEANIPGTYYATKEATIQLKAVIRNITAISLPPDPARDTSMGDNLLWVKVTVPVIAAIAIVSVVLVVVIIRRKRRQSLSARSSLTKPRPKVHHKLFSISQPQRSMIWFWIRVNITTHSLNKTAPHRASIHTQRYLGVKAVHMKTLDRQFSGAGTAPKPQHSVPNLENHVCDDTDVCAPAQLDNTIPTIIFKR